MLLMFWIDKLCNNNLMEKNYQIVLILTLSNLSILKVPEALICQNSAFCPKGAEGQKYLYILESTKYLSNHLLIYFQVGFENGLQIREYGRRDSSR
jgi:hypothetical protein